MKSKAELVVELDKMTKVRDELTQEVLSLSAQLEQERSKVNQLTLDVKKAHVSIFCMHVKLVMSPTFCHFCKVSILPICPNFMY